MCSNVGSLCLCGFLGPYRSPELHLAGEAHAAQGQLKVAPAIDHGALTIALQARVAVKELRLKYHNSESILFRIYPYYGNLN